SSAGAKERAGFGGILAIFDRPHDQDRLAAALRAALAAAAAAAAAATARIWAASGCSEYRIVRAVMPFPASPLSSSRGLGRSGTLTQAKRMSVAGRPLTTQVLRPWISRQRPFVPPGQLAAGLTLTTSQLVGG
ncbi:MAG: hypothetical protein WB592_12710, partial [Acidimicrobiales bacterium]